MDVPTFTRSSDARSPSGWAPSRTHSPIACARCGCGHGTLQPRVVAPLGACGRTRPFCGHAWCRNLRAESHPCPWQGGEPALPRAIRPAHHDRLRLSVVRSRPGLLRVVGSVIGSGVARHLRSRVRGCPGVARADRVAPPGRLVGAAPVSSPFPVRRGFTSEATLRSGALRVARGSGPDDCGAGGSPDADPGTRDQRPDPRAGAPRGARGEARQGNRNGPSSAHDRHGAVRESTLAASQAHWAGPPTRRRSRLPEADRQTDLGWYASSARSQDLPGSIGRQRNAR